MNPQILRIDKSKELSQKIISQKHERTLI